MPRSIIQARKCADYKDTNLCLILYYVFTARNSGNERITGKSAVFFIVEITKRNSTKFSTGGSAIKVIRRI
jgi:hypothetical protein